MPLTKRQIQRRSRDLGASDIAAVCGVDDYRTPWDVWAEKTGLLIPRDEADGGEAIEIGHALEPVLRKWAEHRIGPIKRLGLERRISGTPVLCHLDGITEDGIPTEIKTTGFAGPIVGVWGVDGTDIIPDKVRIQVTVQMMATDSDRGYVISWLGGVGRRLYPIPRSEKLCEAILAAVSIFWDCINENTPPKDSTASLEVAKHIRRIEGSVAQVDPESLSTLRHVRKQRLELQRQEKGLMGNVLAQLGDSEIADGGDGEQMTYLAQESRKLDQQLLKTKHPDAFAACMRTTTHRVARFRDTAIQIMIGDNDAN